MKTKEQKEFEREGFRPVPPSSEALLRGLRERVVTALGVNNPQEVLDHVVSQSCEEIEALASVLEDHKEPVIGSCAIALRGIVERLLLAIELEHGMWDPDRPEATLLPDAKWERVAR
jgi:hypothetical protein